MQKYASFLLPWPYLNIATTYLHQIEYRDFFKGLGTFAFTNYVKIFALVKNTCTFSSYFIIFLCNSEVITGFILLLTVTCNIRQRTTISAYQTGCQKSAGF